MCANDKWEVREKTNWGEGGKSLQSPCFYYLFTSQFSLLCSLPSEHREQATKNLTLMSNIKRVYKTTCHSSNKYHKEKKLSFIYILYLIIWPCCYVACVINLVSFAAVVWAHRATDSGECCVTSPNDGCKGVD